MLQFLFMLAWMKRVKTYSNASNLELNKEGTENYKWHGSHSLILLAARIYDEDLKKNWNVSQVSYFVSHAEQEKLPLSLFESIYLRFSKKKVILSCPKSDILGLNSSSLKTQTHSDSFSCLWQPLAKLHGCSFPIYKNAKNV